MRGETQLPLAKYEGKRSVSIKTVFFSAMFSKCNSSKLNSLDQYAQDGQSQFFVQSTTLAGSNPVLNDFC